MVYVIKWIPNTASTTLPNSASIPSPVVFTMRPRCSAILGSQGAQMVLELGVRPLLIQASQRTVASDISRQDSCEPSLYTLGGQACPP